MDISGCLERANFPVILWLHFRHLKPDANRRITASAVRYSSFYQFSSVTARSVARNHVYRFCFLERIICSQNPLTHSIVSITIWGFIPAHLALAGFFMWCSFKLRFFLEGRRFESQKYQSLSKLVVVRCYRTRYRTWSVDTLCRFQGHGSDAFPWCFWSQSLWIYPFHDTRAPCFSAKMTVYPLIREAYRLILCSFLAIVLLPGI